ncbi:hypothetical protein ACH4VS_06710 [Streptomyces hygroscopicus]|uniref:hypothetical protein n=1 Tax=Streptomyces hygroscopicus TaxID=1912 RepID=UPI000831D734|nr:hypothetical protein [Streptomyces hygroscopicus]GLV72125.1 hypothetical protein Shyhy02_01280 [Streptomyces hygroscopicus subsp. hygroscopicus]
MSDPNTPKTAPAGTDAVMALLRAVHDALDLPLPGLTDQDEREHYYLLTDRAAAARVVLAGVLDRGFAFESAAAYLRDRTDGAPVTYTPWEDKGGPA